MKTNCDNCSKEYYIKPSRYARNSRHFCSEACRTSGKVTICANCRSPVKVDHIDESKQYYCGSSCETQHYQSRINVSCHVCKKGLFRPTTEINESGVYFCSNECKVNNGNRYTDVDCVVCEKTFTKPTADVNRSPNHCCTVECRSIFNSRTETSQCRCCGTDVSRPRSLFVGRANIFCSEKCHNEFQDTKVEMKCAKCHISFRLSPFFSTNNFTEKYFCSKECSSKFRFQNTFIEQQFSKMLDEAGIKHVRNDRTAIKPLELDFWIPELKYAIEINGPTHYKPVFGEESLASQKARDKRKRAACKELGIKLRVVKPANWRNGVCQRRFRAVIREIKNETYML